ncbi:thioredoxin-like protein [Ramicandelaber brevisporus]|nr:thioredoxin-like protein [Ramicandelaber brevisporus]
MLLLAQLALSSPAPAPAPTPAPPVPPPTAPKERFPGGVSHPLTAKNMKEIISNGYWFIKFFSPTCPHCTAMAPTWKKLAADNKHLALSNVRYAEVNCLDNFEYCMQLGIGGWPTLRMYKDGKRAKDYELYDHTYQALPPHNEEHSKNHDVIKLPKPPVQQKAPKSEPEHESEPKPEPPVPVNTKGEVVDLTPSNFAKSISAGPWFVEYYSPTCPHCRKVAPTWVEVGKSLKNKVNVARVNCNEYMQFCMSHGVDGFPTFQFYLEEENTHYNGKRNLDDFVKFATNLLTIDDKNIPRSQVDSAKDKSDVLFVYIDRDSGNVDNRARANVKNAALSLFQQHRIVFTIDSSVAHVNEVEQLPALLVFKDGSSKVFAGELHNAEAVKAWMRTERASLYPKLDESNYSKLFSETEYLVITVVDPSSESGKSLKDEGLEAAKEYRISSVIAGRRSSSVAKFAWLDANKWKPYLKRVFDMNPQDVPRVIVMNTSKKTYWDTGSNKKLIGHTQEEILDALDGILDGKIEGKSSVGVFNRVAHTVGDGIGQAAINAYNNPLPAALACLFSLVVIIFVLRRFCCSGDSTYHEVKAD